MNDDDGQIIIKRTLNASPKQVWRAWTKPEIVKKWWGPEGFSSPSIEIDLRVGGKYIFALHGSKSTEFDKDFYSAGIYKEIVPHRKLVVTDYFSDKHGKKIDPSTVGMSSDMPEEMEATVKFVEISENKTNILIIYPKPESQEEIEVLEKSGMVEGWNSSLNKLEELLEKNP